MTTRPLLVPLLGLLLACGSDPEKGPYDTDPLEPAAAVESFELVEGFEIELYAAEPHVVDPVEIAWDEAGGVYVAEMLDYPFDPESGEPPRSRVRFLEDGDGDGVIDQATIFADRLLQATSVFPWKGGVFVASAPDILYLRDDDGDHVADTREVWYTGFDTDVSSESRITNFRLGVDGWIYAANNGRAGEITSPKFPDKDPVLVRGYDFRFDPVTGDFEPAAGPTQFGMSFDAFGARFVTQNTVHLRHAVLPARYARRNRHYAPESMLHYVPDDDPRNSVVYPLTEPQQWRVERTALRQERYQATQPGRVERLEGHFTAATGTTVYLGDAFGEDFYGNVFVADINGGLVHRELLFDDGPTFRSEPRPAGREFLASHDSWFRPANLANAPDGNLYVLDFYREYIEEPASIPIAIQEKLQLDFYRGNDRGRIWRIRRSGASGGLQPGLADADLATLAATLESPNGWRRRTAQRLLLEAGDAAAASSLRRLAGQSERPETRLHALWLLASLGVVTSDDVQAALSDEHPRVRAGALALAERFLPELEDEIVRLSDDADAKVRFQAALSAGESPDPAPTLAAVAARDGADPWFRAAVLSGAGRAPYRLLNRLLTRHPGFFQDGDGVEGRRALVRALAAILGARADSRELAMLLQALNGAAPLRPAPWRAAALSGLAEGLSGSRQRGLDVPGAEGIFARWIGSEQAEVRDAALEAGAYFSLPRLQAEARRVAADVSIGADRRARALRFLRGGQAAEVVPLARQTLAEPAPAMVHLAALDALGGFESRNAAQAALAGWDGYAPEVRSRTVDLLLRRASWTDALLDAVESGAVGAASVDPVAKIRLGQHPDADVRERADALLGAGASDRAGVVDAYQDVLELDSNAERGAAIFDEHCAKCHLPQGERSRLGPNLAGINNKTAGELLAHILDPSFEIQASYANYLVVDADGRLYDGLLAGETENAVTLRGEYETFTVPREAIAEMRASNVSLMPAGLEQDMTRQELADVIAYLRGGL